MTDRRHRGHGRRDRAGGNALHAGFPAIWLGILPERDVGEAGFAGLLSAYVLVCLSVELATFAVAVAVTGSRPMSLGRMGEGHGRALQLLGGAVTVALAGALALRPEMMEDLIGTLVLFGAALGLAALVLLGHRRATAG